ncbi:uncharacterized protein LOC133888829 [Phragmites australis]|uniref:uncharacterized protein LOC133888829 n=1 Tax=Phragmites australis TaxID=29695 RepID=UPI002D766788|nr:uncharacterized protein LOC133888829 [Phragmites australis]
MAIGLGSTFASLFTLHWPDAAGQALLQRTAPKVTGAHSQREVTGSIDGLKRTQDQIGPEHALRRAQQTALPLLEAAREAYAQGGGMGGVSPPGNARCALLLSLELCALLPWPSAAFFFGSVAQSRGGGYREEKVPMTVVVPDYSPRPAPLGPSLAPAPVPGSDDDGGMPRLPSERWSSGAPSSSGGARAPAGSRSTDFISSSPAVPLPAGVTDSATALPMPTPGQQRQDEVGMGTLQLEARAVQLAIPLAMMLSFWALQS